MKSMLMKYKVITNLLNMKNRLMNITLGGIIFVTLFFGLWPLRFNPPNRVERLKNEPGIRITGRGHLYTPPGIERFFSDQNITLEILMKPLNHKTNRYCQILSVYDGARQDVFVIGQYKDELYFRIRNPNPRQSKKYRERGKDHFLIGERKVLVALTSNRVMTSLYANGRRSESFPNFSLLKGSGTGSERLILANSADGGHWWKGDILGLALYNRILSDQEIRMHQIFWSQQKHQELKSASGLVGLYFFNENQGEWVLNQAGKPYPLFKPAVFQPLRRDILGWPTRNYMRTHSFYQDAVINLIGFIPLGFFAALRLLRFNHRPVPISLTLTLILGFLISLNIELIQGWLPTRDSSVSDLIFNILGTAAGAGLVLLLWPTKNIA
ncbi:MAG: VanZ family protein [Thermodesulfobacteriota bacterium]